MKRDSTRIIYGPAIRVTPWFTSEEPLYPGAYERAIDDLGIHNTLYSYWDGLEWFQAAHSPERAEQLYERGYKTAYQLTDPSQRWRGLSEDRRA